MLEAITHNGKTYVEIDLVIIAFQETLKELFALQGAKHKRWSRNLNFHDAVLNVIKNYSPITKANLTKKTQYMTAFERNKALDFLETNGFIRSTEEDGVTRPLTMFHALEVDQLKDEPKES